MYIYLLVYVVKSDSQNRMLSLLCCFDTCNLSDIVDRGWKVNDLLNVFLFSDSVKTMFMSSETF